MKLTKRKDSKDSIRKVWSDDKEVLFGIVGTVADLLRVGILEWADYPGETWCFINAPGIMLETKFGPTREASLAHLPK